MNKETRFNLLLIIEIIEKTKFIIPYVIKIKLKSIPSFINNFKIPDIKIDITKIAGTNCLLDIIPFLFEIPLLYKGHKNNIV